MNAHPDTWPIVPIAEDEFNQLREQQYPRVLHEQIKRKHGSGWLRGTLIRQGVNTSGNRVDHILWEHIWIYKR